MHVRELELPDGLERVGEGWLCESAVERVVVPRSVRVFEDCAFQRSRVREVVVYRDSQLKTIGRGCFQGSDIRNFYPPGSLRCVCDGAFYQCAKLELFYFWNADSLEWIGEDAFRDSGLHSFES